MSDKKTFEEPVAAATNAAKDFDVGEVVDGHQSAEDGQYRRTISSRQIHVGRPLHGWHTPRPLR